MKKIICFAASLFFYTQFAPNALAQNPGGASCTYISYGAVLTAAQWNYCFQIKQDYLGYTPVNKAGDIMLGPLVTIASSGSAAGFNMPAGSAPSSPNNGDMWSTTLGLYIRINGVTIGPLSGATSSSFAASNPLAVTFPSGIVTYALNYNSSLTLDGSNNLGINLAHSNAFTVSQSIAGLTVTSAFTATGLVTNADLVNPGLTLGSTALTLGVTTTSISGLTLASPTVTGAFTATGLVTNSDLVNSGLTLGSTALTLGATTTTVAGLTLTSPTINGAALSSTFSGNPTFSGNVFHTAQNINSGTSAPASAAGNTVIMGTIAAPTLANNGQAFLYNTAVNGASLQGQGSTFDASMLDNAGAVALGITTGTQNVVFNGQITAASLATGGTVAGSLCATSGGVLNYKAGINCYTSGAATSLAPGTTTISPTNNKYTLYDNSGVLAEAQPALLASSVVSSPTGSASSTGLMQGLGSTCKLTPSISSRVEVVFYAIASNSTATGSARAQVAYGTGTAPVNGASPAGTVVGALMQATSITSNASVPIYMSNIITGLTPGTAYWFDINLAYGGASTASLANVACEAKELF